MTNQQYKVIGIFFVHYKSNLSHLRNFKRFKKGKTSFEEYAAKGDHTFPRFLSDFKVARNVESGSVIKLLKITQKWIASKNADSVDLFANAINRKSLTHGKIMTSLASKILFLNNPHVILPLDSRVRVSVGQKSNYYADYFPVIKKFEKVHEFTECLRFVEKFAIQVESNFKSEILNLELIRKNRLLDIFLWSINGEMESAFLENN